MPFINSVTQGQTPGKARRDHLDTLWTTLDSERSSFTSHWRELAEYIQPRRGRFFLADANRGDRRSQKIIDSTATMSARTLSAGMMAGVTSPARPWFRLQTPNPELNKIGAVKKWLEDVERIIKNIFIRSNLYNTLPTVYKDIGVFATASLYVEEDFETVIRTESFPVGSYLFGNDSKLRVRVFMREFRMTVRQIVQQFGRADEDTPDDKIDWTNISEYIKALYLNGQYESWVDVRHVIFPNPKYDPTKLEAKFKKFYSAYYEKGTSTNQSANYMKSDPDKFLSESGFDEFPILGPRWEVTGEDVYGTSCPGMEALGDIRQLQVGEKRSAQAIDKMVNPPMVGPSSLRTVRASLLPGDITYADEREGQKGFRPAHEVNPRINELEAKQEQTRQRIRRAFFEDLFLMLASSDRRQITAREIEERHEEKLLALGPVLEQLNQDLLDPLIDRTFAIAFRQGLIPAPPPELEGVNLRVEYISVMAQAQKLVGVANIERFAGFIGGVAQVQPDILDKVNSDELANVYGDMTSIPQGIVRSDDEVAKLRQARQQATQQAQQAEQASMLAKTARDASQASMEGDTALTRATDALGGQVSL